MSPVNDGSELENRKTSAIDTLTDRFARNDIPMDEYERLVADVNRAQDFRELAVIEDIVSGAAGPSPHSVPHSAPRPAPRRAAASPIARSDPDSPFIGEENVQSSYAVLSERRLTGEWLRKPNAAVLSFLGSHVVDMRGMELPPGPTTLEAFALLGSVEIVVPQELAVRMEAVPVAGEVRIGKTVETRERAGEPVLVITGNAILGSIEVKRR